MFTCPTCNKKLIKGKTSHGIMWICPDCQGKTATISSLRRVVPPYIANRLWQSARTGKHPRNRPCPACRKLMPEVPVQGKEKTEYIDICTHCHFMWFDPSEYESLPEIESKPERKDTLPQEAHERLALLNLNDERIKAEQSNWEQEMPEDVWKFIPAFFGMPVEYNTNTLQRAPWITWITSFIVLVISLLAFGDYRNIIENFGLIPAEAERYGGLTLVTSFFLHGGIFHLLSNMYFFLVFGDNVEDYLGKCQFFFLLLLSTVAGDIAHVIGDPASTVPCIGASGGIAGIIAFYALTFPRARLSFLLRVYFLPIIKWIQMPAWVLFIIWMGLQFFGAWKQLSGFSNVSYLAHLGGASVGIIFWSIFRKTK